MKKNTNYYDLDGTLSKLNNSYDFAFDYLKENNKKRFYFAKIIHFFLERLFFINYIKRRKLILSVMFKGLSVKNLEKYYKATYENKFLNTLTSLGVKVAKNKNGIILTGCTSIPAKFIGKTLNMPVICTAFKIKNGKISYIEKDTFGPLKANYIKRKKNETITYYTDDYKNEKNLEQIVTRLEVVK